ncbi:hypothetical protein EJA19_00040 [Mangrovimonas spongiae]|uniref:Transmembrane protein n=1 Tax=Mangrovimonas spongiae TaxID=2494697 RepID=A0A3R9MUT3_9FLAO|nr:hypothetical protein EJA19_00040 [Mangrovimonas spongiae]
MRGLALNFASTHQVGNSCGISKVGKNKQLLIAIVVLSLFFSVFIQPFNSIPTWTCSTEFRKVQIRIVRLYKSD